MAKTKKFKAIKMWAVKPINSDWIWNRVVSDPLSKEIFSTKKEAELMQSKHWQPSQIVRVLITPID